MVQRNEVFSRLRSSYLFFEIAQRKERFLKENPGVELVNLGIGDTTLPIPRVISEAMSEAANKLGTEEGYSGYGPGAGIPSLRDKISEICYRGTVSPDEIFISDGSKCDIGRFQTLFGPNVAVAVQDPTYPAYVDGSLLHGVTEIQMMPCLPENQFFPDLSRIKRPDLIYFCSPNNPTGSAATREQLANLVSFALDQQSVIIYDAAYSGYIRDGSLPRSIFEVPEAKKCAVETCSFSKLAGFTGVRLGWTVVPKELKYSDQTSIYQDWLRVVSTVFNGASNIAQAGGLSALSEEGRSEINELVSRYMTGAARLSAALKSLDLEVYGGENCPYLWVRFPGKSSWDMFQQLLEESQIVATPGAGFGPSGEEFIRFSAFAPPKQIDQALTQLNDRILVV